MQQAGVCSTVYRKRSSIYDSLTALLLVSWDQKSSNRSGKQTVGSPLGSQRAQSTVVNTGGCGSPTHGSTRKTGPKSLHASKSSLSVQPYRVPETRGWFLPALASGERTSREIPAQQGAALQVAKRADFHLPLFRAKQRGLSVGWVMSKWKDQIIAYKHLKK